MSTMHHTMTYVEFGVHDVAAAKGFYSKVFGWEFNDYGPTYAGIRGPGGEDEVGGLNGGGSPGRGGTLVLISSDDVEASAAAVQSAGGTIVEPVAPYPGGRRFTFTDPSGNWLGVYSQDMVKPT